MLFRAAFAVTFLCLPITTQALEIKGAYGNAEGCKLLKTGLADNDSLLLVTAEQITSYGTGCEIVQLLQSKNGNEAVAVGLCGYEGEDYPGVEHYVIRKTESNPPALKIYQSSGDLWGELPPCP